MTTELEMLVLSGVLCLTLPAIYFTGRLRVPGGNAWMLGNRDAALEAPAWVARAQRAHANLVENLPPFIILVLVAHAIGVENDVTALGAVVFFAARFGHAVSYVAGVVYLRTLFFFAAIIGEILLFSQLLPELI